MKAASAPAGRARAWRWAIVLLAILPFELPILQHWWTSGIEGTGFMGYDAPYYAANGRAIFERGNGFFHPNPYDPSPTAPVIYFHWLTWLLGFGIKVLGFDPGVLFTAVGIGAGLVGSALTLRLIEAVLPDRRGRLMLFLLAMWGGGFLCFGGLVADLAQGRSLDEVRWFQFDEAGGWWFFNWGRNFVLATEAVYHVVVLVLWLAVVRQRWGLALAAAGALAATHPFSGLQHLLILGAWLGVLALRERTPAAWRRVLILAAMLAVFLGYYFGYLDSFPQHRALRAYWMRISPLSMLTFVLATAPVAGLAGWRIWRDRGRLAQHDWFFLLAGLITLLLMKHDWFIAARQPVHFSRGYNWLPFCLVALPALQAWGVQQSERGWRRPAIAGLALGVGLMLFDNVVFLVHEWRSGELDRHHLTPAQRDVFAWIDRAKLRGVLLSADPRLSYLAATYSGVRPFYGHIANTPDVYLRWAQVAKWQREGESGAWMQQIDYVLIERRHPPVKFDASRWHELMRNDDYLLLGRPPPTGGN